MVERQLRRRGIEDERVLAAMSSVPRERFLPAELGRTAYRDAAVPIAEGQTMSQPWIVACMTSLLGLRGDERVLEIGTGSGYGAAVLARVSAGVVSVERHRALADQARVVLAELGFANVEVRVGDGTRGAPDCAPFDAIVVTAVAEAEPPPALVEQLAEGAPLVCPVRDAVGEHLTLFRGGERRRVVPVRFVPLVAGEAGEA
jgi:protein-L-isoaspartate(D-aspartate) O-methyltransferase